MPEGKARKAREAKTITWLTEDNWCSNRATNDKESNISLVGRGRV